MSDAAQATADETPSTPVVYIGIGNSDNRLTQQRWSDFVSRVEYHVHTFTHWTRITGAGLTPSGGAKVVWEGFSAPASPYQNACWCVSIPADASDDDVTALKATLAACAVRFDQDSIAWAVAPVTELLTASSALEGD
jgi:hypothetical protein